MEKNLEKSLKRFLKRKVKITTAFIVAFLLGSLTAYGDIQVKYENSEIKFYRDNNDITEEMKKIGTVTGNLTDGFVWTINGEIAEQIKIDSSIKNISFNIINNGKISENSTDGNYSGNGISNKSYAVIRTIINNGIISGNSTGGSYSGNGIDCYYLTIRDLINNGIISGNSTGGNYSGNGINNYSSTIGDLTNSGIIAGSANGINNQMSATISNIINSGKILGLNNGIENYTQFSVKNIINKGIIAGNNKAVYKVDENNIKNFGLLIDGAGTDTQKITAGAEGEQKIPVEFNDDGSVKTTETKFIINGTDKTGEGTNTLALNSSDLKNKISEDKKGNYFNETENSYQDLIINVVGDNNNSLNINSDFNISKSTINGYKDAVVFSADKKTFTGDSVSINAGENAFMGSNSSDNINLSNNSTVNGNINLGNGEDKITFDTSILNGDIIGDNDTIIFDKSQINGNITSSNGKITISGGENTLFNTGSSVINGNITLTDGEISIAEGTQINGNITMKGDSATVYLDRNKTDINNKINIENNTKQVLGLSYNINTDADLTDMKNQISTMKAQSSTSNFKDFETIRLSDRGNSNVNLTGITEIKSVIGGNGNDKFIISAGELQNISINGGTNNTNETKGDTLELTTAVDNTATGNPNLFDNINNIENLKLANAEENKLDINNLAADGNIKFKNYVGGNKDDEFTVSFDNFEKLSLIDGGANETDKGDTLTINETKNDKEIFLNKTTGIENFEITSKNYTNNIINIDNWDYLNSNKNKINISVTANGTSIKGSKESIGNLQNITGDGNTSVILTNNISDKNVSDINGNTGNKDENYDFVKNLSNISDIYLAKGHNYVDVNKIVEINPNIYTDKYWNINSENNSEANYFKVSLKNLHENKISLYGSDSTEDTIEITDKFENNIFYIQSISGIEKLVLSKEGNNVLIDSQLVKTSGLNEIIGKDGGKEGNTFTINDIQPEDEILGMKIEGGTSSNDTLKIDTENITLSNTYDTLEKILINKTGIENLVLGNANNNINFTYTDKDKNLSDFKNITGGNKTDAFTVSTEQLSYKIGDEIKYMNINGGADESGNPYSDNDSLKLSGILNNNTEENKNILSGVSNIENLYLDNEENILNLNYTNGFTSVTGGNKNDTFIISADKLTRITINDNGTAGNDTLKITSGGINNTGNDDFLKNISAVENLILAENSSNFVKLDNVSFNTITKNGTGQDNFYITSNSDKLKMTINGGSDNDVITIENIAVDNTAETGDTEYLKNIHGVESLNLSNNGGNKLFFNKDNINDFKFISATQDSSITLDNLKNITVWFQGVINNELTVKNDNGIFNHEVTNASKITLDGDNKVWKFAKEGKIGNSNNTVLDLNENSLEFSEKLSLGTDGKLSFGDIGFVSSGKVTLENGNIKVGLSDNVTFDKGTNTKFTLTDENEIAFGSNLNLETYSFLNTSYDNSAKQFNIGVKSWDDLLKDTAGTTEENILFADTYDYILKEYYNQDKDTDKTITNAFNTFGSNAIAEYIKTVKEYGITKELILLSEDGEFKSTVTGTVSIGTDETKTDRNNKLTFNNISAKDFKINVAEGTDNNISFTGAVTLNNGIKISDTSEGNINISLKENESVNLGDIDFGNKKGTLDIEDTSVIESIGTITNGDISVGAADTEGFNKILISSNNGVENISVKEKTELEIKNDYNGKLSFEKENNTITLKSNEQETFKDYSGNIVFEKGGNTLTVAENIDVSGKISVNEETNNITVNGTANALIFEQNSNKNSVAVNGKLSNLGFTENSSENTIKINGTLESGIDFGENSYGNILTISENGSVGKDIKFGTGTGDEFKLSSKNGIFNYNITNADIINLSGTKGEWNFAGGKITGSNVAVNINDNGIIGFNIGKSNTGLVLGKNGINPFAETGNYIVNGDIKVTFDDTVKFTSLSDTLKATGSNISLGKNYNIIVPEFMKYDSSKKEFAIKSAEELKSAGLQDYAIGNYEHAILNYNKEGYGSLTTLLNNNSLTQISAVLNKGIDEKDYYFYSDDREIKDMATIGDIYIKTSKDNKVTDKDTDIKFTNVTGNTANISFAKDTTNTVSFLEGTNLSKIDGSGSEAGFTLNLNGVNFSNKENEKETKVTMSNFDDILNINSAIKDISVDTGNGDDTVNILSSINGTFDGNGGNNTLNIGTKLNEKISDENSQKNIILSGEIKNFQSISLNQNTNFDSSLKISGTNEIELNGNNLFLEVDYGKKADEKVIGHALYNNGIKVDNSTGKVMIDIAEADDGTIISMGDKNKSEFVNTDKENLIESGSSNHHIEIADGDIVVKVNNHIMGDGETTGAIKYAHLDKIYQSIVSADKIDEMSETTTLSDKTKEEAIKAQLEFYGKIYHSTPYAYSHEISEKSAELITNSLINSKTMPEFKKWIFGGSIAGQEADSDNNFYGANYYGVDNTKAEADIESNIYGAYAFGEYGIAEKQSVGFAVAGTKSNTDISGNSKIKGNSVFVSAYAKQEINNLRMITGLGYQHSFYDSTRTVSNDYQSMSVDKKYEDDLFTIFAGARYSYSLGNNFFLEPNAKLNISHTMQNDINETDNNNLSIEVKEQDFTSVDTEIGLDLVKKINLQKGILNLKLGTSFIYSLEGHEEEYMKAKITGAEKDFEIISPESDRERVRFNIVAEYETEKGMFYNLHGNYITSSNETDYCVSFGAGYKF